MISIVMPSWNRETFLPECIRSIQAQTYKNWELIIVDDGSTDGSHYLYDFYTKQDKRIKVLYVKHGGIAKARNAGIKESKGEYIAVFDSDDVMFPTRLAENFEALKKVDFCTSFYLSADKDMTEDGTFLVESPTKVTLEDVKNNNSWPHFMITAHKKCFIENPYREDFVVNDDNWIMWTWFKASYTYKVIEKPLGIQRGHSGNSSKTRLKELKEVQDIMNKEYDEYEG
jgi:glycosyltransferase involved in cell wall biosynthesis